MEMTRKIVGAVKAAIRKKYGKRELKVCEWVWTDAETGEDCGQDNYLFVPAEAVGLDVDEATPIDDLVGEEFEDLDGWVALDLRLYNTEDALRRAEEKGKDLDELDCNTYVLIAPDGTVALVTDESGRLEEVLNRHGVSLYEDAAE